MIDGKTFSAVTNKSTQVCGICGATPKQMNDLSALEILVPNIDAYDYGLSTLHAWIRCFKNILAYRLDIKKWQIRGKNEERLGFVNVKASIREKLRLEMGLLVDIPKLGCGTTNDGNTASRFFQQPSLASAITGIDEELIYRFNVILTTIFCGFPINLVSL